jgi:hypothetical protein
MSTFRSRWLLPGAAVIALSGTAFGGVSSASALSTRAAKAASTPYCGIKWGSLPKAGGSNSAPLVASRTGQHSCFDRLVFDFNGAANRYSVQYANEVYTEGRGLPLSPQTAGGALLKVVLLEPAYDEAGRDTYRHQPTDHVAKVSGYRTLRDVVYGGSFEGQTTFAVGVRARLPFRIFALSGPGSSSRIVLDVAHRWS